ncbi:MAG: hypothetical protein ABS57_21930 [Mesorhizobium sp. SCN 65-12]|nr:MAG: hypothetical protein ABS57_21930 [Mesorhizobium sp. SCN 65-12]
MAEKESYERTVERLCGEIDALRSILLAVAEELPERATYHIEEHARQLRQDADNDAKAKPNDRRQDYAAGIWDTASAIEEVLAMRRDELEQGARVRTVQPAPIAEGERVFPDKGW